MSNLKKQAISGVIWTFTQQFSVQLINFGVQIILARLLMPEDFGLIAMLMVFVSIGQSLMDGGMTSSLIRMKEPKQVDFSTVFVTNLGVSIIIYALVFTAAPFIADFYDQDLLKDILRVFALTFVIRSFVAVHVTKLTKEMNFKTQMKLQVPSTIVGAIVGVVMAYSGYGVWSLVWLNLTQTILFTIQNWIFIKWRPSLIFDKNRFKYHFNFGYKLTLSGLLDTIYNDAYRIVIGKFFSPAQVGFFNQAEIMRLFPVLQLSSVINKVTYPLFSNINNDEQLKKAYKTTLKILFLIVVPVMMSLIVCAKDIFYVIFGEKWLPSVPYFQILAFASIVRPLASYNLNILKVKGRSDLFLKLEIYKKIIGVIIITFALPYGILGLVIASCISFHIMVAIDIYFSGKLIKYGFFEQFKDCFNIYIIGMITLVTTYLIQKYLVVFEFNIFINLTLSLIFFFVLYFALIFIIENNFIKQIKKQIILR